MSFIFANSDLRHICDKKIAFRAWFTYISKRQRDLIISRGFYFHETSHMRSFAKIKPSRKFLNLQYIYIYFPASLVEQFHDDVFVMLINVKMQQLLAFNIYQHDKFHARLHRE